MKRIQYMIAAMGFLTLVGACSGQNDNFDQYLENGERTYIGKVDSVKIFSGIGRMKMQMWSSDPRAVKLNVFWANRKDSVQVTIPPHAKKDSIEITIDGGHEKLEERDYVFEFVTYDEFNNRSMVVEEIGEVYGDFYLNARYDIPVNYVAFNKPRTGGHQIQLKFGNKASLSEYGVHIRWMSGNKALEKWGYRDTFLLREDMNSTIVLPDAYSHKTDHELMYQSVFLPQENAIDTVYMPEFKVNERPSEWINVGIN